MTNKPQLNLLLIEDSDDDALLIERELARNYQVISSRVQSAEEFDQALTNTNPHIIIADYTLPAFSALSALQFLTMKNKDVPFIVVSGRVGEDTAVQVMKAGADDYICKDNLARLLPAVERECREALLRQEARSEQLRLEREILEISTEAQKRIGRDLHDNLGQLLTGIAFRAKVLEEKLQDSEASKDTSAIVDLINQAISQTRELAKGLCPVEIGESGLNDALTTLAESSQQLFGIPCSFTSQGPQQLSEPEATHFYYIAREAVTNAARHANCKTISIELNMETEMTILTITDDGTGMTDESEGSGLGLKLMKYRAHLIQGSLDIESKPAKGTEISCRVNHE